MPRLRRPRSSGADALSVEQVAEIGRRFTDGATLDGLATDYDLRLAEVTGILDRQGIQWRQDYTAVKDARRQFEDRVIDRYLEGGSAATVGGEFDLSAHQVLAILENRGVPRRPRGLRTAGRTHTEQAIEAVLGGQPLRAVAHEYRLNASRLAARLIIRWRAEDEGGDTSEEIPGLVHQVAQEYLAGATVTEIAEAHGMSGPTQVSRLLIRYAEDRTRVTVS